MHFYNNSLWSDWGFCLAAVLSNFIFQTSLRTQTQVMQILGTNYSVEREMGSPSALLPHPHIHCAQEGLRRGSGRGCMAFEPSDRYILRSSLATVSVCVWETVGSRGPLQRHCCSCCGEPWVTHKENITYLVVSWKATLPVWQFAQQHDCPAKWGE